MEQTLLFTVRREIDHSGLACGSRRAEVDRASVEFACASRGHQPPKRAQELRLAVTGNASEPKDFTPVHLEAYVLKSRPTPAPHGEAVWSLGRPRGPFRREGMRHLSADDETQHLFVVHLVNPPGPLDGSVAHDGHTRGNLPNFV